MSMRLVSRGHGMDEAGHFVEQLNLNVLSTTITVVLGRFLSNYQAVRIERHRSLGKRPYGKDV
ncbi:hypothetical protein, partial [Acinetobacter nosocomialis]|uniref:hypothetical protein n=1 Tax=Acinetobacter nosocomialis TaxID=106654 RepID=UPI001C08B6CC